MFQKVRNHLILALIFFILSLAQQYGFYALKGFPVIWLGPAKYLAIYLSFLIFSFSPGPKTRFILLSYLLILNLFQMGHLSYFGTQALPNQIYLFFMELHEVSGTLQEELQHLFIPLIFTIAPMSIGYYFIRKFKDAYSYKVLPILVIAYFIYNPARTYFTGNTWGRQPSTREMDGMNFYLSLSYCLGKIVPHKLSSKRFSLKENESLKLEMTKEKESDWDNVIVVLGESLTPDHMSLFNYQRPTTPYLEELKKSRYFFHTRGLSSGVSTDVSTAFFLNMTYGDAGAIKAAKAEHCLFRLAKKIGFSTHFLSIQSSDQLRYIAPFLCSAYLDDFRGLENISPATENPNAAIDRHLLPKLADLLKLKNNNFIMLHQRGSHAPWALRFTEEATKFKSEDTDQRINDYDNSVVEFDLFWKELDEILSQTKTKNLVIYLSDHGESLGKNQIWGHGFLLPPSFEIPIIIQSYNRKLPKRTRQLPVNLPQYSLSLFLVNELGYKTNQDSHTIMKDFVIYGNDIDGFAGKAEVNFGLFNKYEINVIP